MQHATSTRRLLATWDTTSGYRTSEGPLPSTSKGKYPEGADNRPLNRDKCETDGFAGSGQSDENEVV